MERGREKDSKERERAGATKRYRNFEREIKRERDRKEGLATQTRQGSGLKAAAAQRFCRNTNLCDKTACFNIYCTKKSSVSVGQDKNDKR